MESTTDIIEALGGRKATAAIFGVTVEAVRNADANGKLPAMWFDALERRLGHPLPRHLFTFKAGAE